MFGPSWSGRRVTLFAEEEVARVNELLAWGWIGGEPFYGWLGNAVHVAEMFVAGFCTWTSFTSQLVNEGDIRAKNIDEFGLRIIDLLPIVANALSAWSDCCMIGKAHLAMRKTPLMFVPLNASTHLSVPGSPWSCVGLTSVLAKHTHQSISISELTTGERGVP
jgi:hypothetical protein